MAFFASQPSPGPSPSIPLPPAEEEFGAFQEGDTEFGAFGSPRMAGKGDEPNLGRDQKGELVLPREYGSIVGECLTHI